MEAGADDKKPAATVRHDGAAAGEGMDRLLFESAGKGHLEMMEFALQNGADANHLSGDGGRRETPLHAATRGLLEDPAGAFGNYPDDDTSIKAIRTLLNYGANPGIADGKGFSLIRLACIRGNVQIVRLFIDASSSIDIDWNGRVPGDGSTALMSACGLHHFDVVELLAESASSIGLDLNAQGQDRIDGWTALHFACNHRRADMARVLLDAGADPMLKDRHGLTPLHFACRGRDFDAMEQVVCVMVERGSLAMLRARTKEGRTPLDIAKSEGNKVVEDILLDDYVKKDQRQQDGGGSCQSNNGGEVPTVFAAPEGARRCQGLDSIPDEVLEPEMKRRRLSRSA